MSASQVSREDSNIANLGSKENHAIRHNAAHKEQAWTDAGQKIGVQVWRIEKFQVKPWPVEKYGQFFSGDAYIVLRTYKPDPKSEKLAWNVHFWLGSSSSQDEQGTAAYKTVELDDFLGEAPVQYREVQGYESDQFRDLFPHLIILDGGVASGFSVVEPTRYVARLLHLHGDRKYVTLSQVALSVDSLDDSDVFVLDDGLTIYQWNGTAANVAEKRKADEVIKAIVAERLGKAKSAVLDGLEKDEKFWAYFGGRPDKVKSTGTEKKAAAAAAAAAVETAVYQLSDAGGELKLSKVAQGKVSRSVLNDSDVFLLDAGSHLFVYVGKNSSVQEKANAIGYATGYLKQQGKGRENSTAIARVVQGAESKAFEALFA